MEGRGGIGFGCSGWRKNGNFISVTLFLSQSYGYATTKFTGKMVLQHAPKLKFIVACTTKRLHIASNPQHFIQRGQTILGFKKASHFQGFHSFFQRQFAYDLGTGVVQDLFPHSLTDL